MRGSGIPCGAIERPALALCLFAAFAAFLYAADGAADALLEENFADLAGWTLSPGLSESGAAVLLPDEQGVLVRGGDLNRDSALLREIDLQGARRLAISMEIRHGYNTGGGAILTPLDSAGQPMRPFTPFKIGAWNSSRWDAYSTSFDLPEGAVRLRIALGVLKGEVAFRRLAIRPAAPQTERKARIEIIKGAGLQVERFEVPRPIWEVACARFESGGEAFAVGCDVDGKIGLGKADSPEWTILHDAGALVFDFAFADIDGDGASEILFSTLDKSAPLTAIDRHGRLVRRYESALGPCKIQTAAVEGDPASPLIAVKPSGGSRALLMDRDGAAIWSTEERTSDICFVRAPNKGICLAVANGAPRLQFWIVDRAGQAEAFQSPDDRQLFNKRMRAGDLDGDGADELVFLRGSVDNVSCYALDGEKRWETPIPANLQNSSFGLLELGDFIPEEKGQEIAVGGSHVLFVLDSSGAIRHQSATDLKGRNESGRRWDPGQLLIPDLAVERGTPDRLWAASSRLRDRAIYRLAFGRNAPFLGQFPIPDDEAHLDALYEAARNAPAQPARDGKFKVIYTRGYFGGMNRETVLDQYRSLKALETDNLEYILMYDASDLMAHPRGSKFSTEQIVADARWMEEHGIPFGYFAMHGGEAWLSDRAIEAALEAAPNAFRFVYAAEDLECFYSPKTDEFLPWCVRMLNLMAPRGKKLLLKEKHDCWATTVADPAMRAALFDPALRQALVPIWATNQPVHPEAQLGAMMGLKDSGWVEEFGMSTQFFNWGEWEQRDINLAHMAPADISLRLELLGAALGAQWLHIEGGQPYMTSPPGAEIDPMARRHRDLVYELIRKGLLRAEPQIANLNATALAMRYHPYFDTLRETNATLKSFKTAGGSSPLRSGFMPMRQILEPWTEWAFAALAYGQRWHVETCFPATPLGWVRIAQEKSPAFEQAQWIETDGERVRLDGEWMDARQARPAVEARLREGAAAIPVSAPNACLVLHRLEGEGSYRAILLDPGYLAPEGVRTALECAAGSFESASDAISGRPLPLANGRVEVDIPRGAFRIVDLRIR